VSGRGGERNSYTQADGREKILRKKNKNVRILGGSRWVISTKFKLKAAESPIFPCFQASRVMIGFLWASCF
jgi:hypothetical protein